MSSGEVKVSDLSASKPQHTDELTLVYDAWPQTRDGVGVEVARDHHLLPGTESVLL